MVGVFSADLNSRLRSLLDPLYPLVQNVTSHCILDTLNHIITQMPEGPVLKDEDPACLGQDIVSPLHVVRVEGCCAFLQCAIVGG